MTIYFNGSYDEFIRAALADGERKASSSRTCGDSFAGASWENAVDYVTNGDTKAAEHIKAAAIDTANVLLANVPSFNIEHRNDGGAFVDVARFVSGEPECWAEFVEQGKTYSRNISIAVNMDFNHGIKASDILALGGKMAGLIMGLRAAGISPRVYAYYPTNGDKQVKVNGKMETIHGQVIIDLTAIDLTKIAATFSPYFLRRIWFSWSELQSREYCSDFGVGSGYGHATTKPIEIPVDICMNENILLMNKTSTALVDIVMKKLTEKGGK